ncbi:DNA adenine methylase [Rothia dentocariosa]|jgi:modification methylase llaDCHIA|uniref:Site-specific DNA-methyltransferase (adenine-specific) n=1 Tax=Rothia dentocariosa TaxID=2047 RepID=A0A3S4YMS1_9MICC|nr:DNA adenine methylase [Rothia dentocariosa]VEJ30971.1 Modification methylase DpnIIA [Rothia dentocariosa]VTY12388.1 Modification methylase DpnIIA [Rothia dentocariosa]
MLNTHQKLKPFTKWTGGKRQILHELTIRMPNKYNHYFEPFIGGGALFFDIQPEKATINDYNTDLMLCYTELRDNLQEVITELKKHEENNSKEYYLNIRSADRDGRLEVFTKAQRAARLLYMLRVNFNGLYRVNSKNQFNVPYGRYKNPKILDERLLQDVSFYLNEADINICQGDFQSSVSKAISGDFVYFDPPYIPLNATSDFTSYTDSGFGFREQIRLMETCRELDRNGVLFMASNSHSPDVFDLYEGFIIETVDASRMINSKATGRGKINEVIIRNYS